MKLYRKVIGFDIYHLNKVGIYDVSYYKLPKTLLKR